MERYLFEERLKKFSELSGWDVETLRGYWQSLNLLPALQRSALNPPAVASHLGLSEDDCLKFFLTGTEAGIFGQRWQVVSPYSGWALGTAPALEQLAGEAVMDPFVGKDVEPDLDSNIYLVFEILNNFFDDREEAYDGNLEHYRGFFQPPFVAPSEELKTYEQELQAGFYVFTPFEFGKVSLTGAPGESYVLYNLEGHCRMTVTIPEKPRRVTASFIQKMITYKDSKQEALPAPIQTLDVELTPQGFSQAKAEFQEGRIVIWVQNTLKTKVGILVMKQGAMRPGIFKKNPMDFGKALLARDLIFTPEFRKKFLTRGMPETLRIKSSTLTILFMNFRNSTAFFDRLGDRKAHEFMVDHFRDLLKIVESHGGFLLKTISDEVLTCFPTPLNAIQAAWEMLQAYENLPGEEKPGLKMGINTGAALMVQGALGIDFFGHMVNLGSKLTNCAGPREIWTSMGTFSGPGVTDFFHDQGFECHQQLVAIRGEDQHSVAYQCIPPAKAEAPGAEAPVAAPAVDSADLAADAPLPLPEDHPLADLIEPPEPVDPAYAAPPPEDNSLALEEVSADSFFS